MSQNRVARSAAQPGNVGMRPRTSETSRETPRPASPPRPRTPYPAKGAEPARRLRGAGARPGGGPGRAGRTAGGANGGVTLLTGLGAALLLLAASTFGALLDMFLVGGPDWALTALFIAACGYSAARVRAADRFAALVAPPLAFAAAVILLAVLMPSTLGHGPLGLTANTFELLAAKAKALYCGTGLTAAILLLRRLRPLNKGARATAGQRKTGGS
ncbi:MAG TPA: DUF6542 domain-containing protein [Actinospica sp.]|nr:DUF6542 domain-containing protein [Actinospica sp.]